MNIKILIKDLLTEKNPLVQRKRARMRAALENTSPTLLCPNCIGGILFHDLGLMFRSPTVNTMMLQTDFAKFVLDLNHYLSQELVFFNHPEYEFPCAKLDDIVIHFTHYHTEQEATQKWKERTKRINQDNLFIFLMERDGLTQDMIRRLGSVRARGLVIFTANSYPDVPYTLQIPKYQQEGEVGNVLALSYLSGNREYEAYFDFVKWFNESNYSGNYDISNFVK